VVNKKGISPLIATVLLIGFTIVLAAVVIRWGSDLFNTQIKTQTCENAATLECTSDVDFAITKADYDENAGTSGVGSLTFSLVNNGALKLENVIVRIRKANGEVIAIDGVTINLPAYGTDTTGTTDVSPSIAIASLNTCGTNGNENCPISIIPKLTHTTDKGDQCEVVCRNEVSKKLDTVVT